MRVTGIAFRLSCLLAAFSVFAAALASHYTFLSGRELLRQQAQHNLRDTTGVLGHRLQSALQTVTRDTVMLAAQSGTAGLFDEQGAPLPGAAPTRLWLAHAFEAMIASHPEYLKIQLIQARQHGQELVRVQRLAAGVQQAPEAELQEKGHFPYVFEALQLPLGQVYMSELAVNRDEGLAPDSPTYTMSAPVESGGHLVGVLVVQVAARPFLRALTSDLPAGFQVYMANRWGDWLVHPDARLVFGFDRGQRFLIQDSLPQAAELITGQQPELVLQTADGDGEPIVTAFRRLPLGREVDQRFLLLGLSQPRKDIDGDVILLGHRAVQVLLMLCVAACLLAVLVSRRVTGPLKLLAQATRRLGRGQQMGELPSERSDEIGELARAFGQMEEQVTRQLSQLRSSHHALDHLAHHDALTGLPNRRMVEARLADALRRTDEAGGICAVLFVDLDHFKTINDRLGHEGGDVVLRAVARRLASGVRDGDLVGRLGGDEFIVICEGIDHEDDAARIAQKLQALFEQPLAYSGLPVGVQASIGISLYPRDGTDVRSLLTRADAGMYRAKNQGRNTFSFS